MKINLLIRSFSVRTKHACPAAGEAGNHGEYHTRIRPMAFIPLISSEPRHITDLFSYSSYRLWDKVATWGIIDTIFYLGYHYTNRFRQQRSIIHGIRPVDRRTT